MLCDYNLLSTAIVISIYIFRYLCCVVTFRFAFLTSAPPPTDACERKKGCVATVYLVLNEFLYMLWYHLSKFFTTSLCTEWSPYIVALCLLLPSPRSSSFLCYQFCIHLIIHSWLLFKVFFKTFYFFLTILLLSDGFRFAFSCDHF